MRNVVPTLLFLLFVHPVFGQGEKVGTTSSRAELPAIYQIEITLVQTKPDGKELVLAQPQLMTLEGQPGIIDIGQNIPAPMGIALPEPPRAGMHALVNVFRKDGQVFLDTTVSKSESSRADAEGVQITTQGVRVVEQITLGRKIVVHPSQEKNVRWEFLVQKPQPKTSSRYATAATRVQYHIGSSRIGNPCDARYNVCR